MKKIFFSLFILALTGTMSLLGQVSIAPLSQYNVGDLHSNPNARTATTVQTDTLKIPYIEDFSGPQLPVEKITVQIVGADTIYQIKQLKLHGLSSGESINVSSGTRNGVDTLLHGRKYVKVIDTYTFQLFDDPSLTDPTPVNPDPLLQIHFISWIPYGYMGYSTYPDLRGFVDNNGGAFINDDIAVNPVNIGVATLDGINYLGFPYSTSNVNGYADKLTSLPFNLSAYRGTDSVFFSFYWQSKSLGSSPISSEYLALEFKDSSGTWRQVWKQLGNPGQTIDTFRNVAIQLKDSLYLHKGFQYQFRNYGLLSGRFNVWNIDYIYINKDIRKGNTETIDVCFINTSRNTLKNYTSIPYKHFKSLSTADQAAQTNDSAYITVYDHRIKYTNDPNISTDFYLRTRDNISGLNIRNMVSHLRALSFTQFLDAQPVNSSLMTAPYVVKQEFTCNVIDTVGPIDLSFNNLKSVETYFNDYYAYDDNTPEVAFLTAQQGDQGIRVANKFAILQTDTLTHIDYCFIKNYGPDVTNSVVTLTIWDDTYGSTGIPTITEKYAQQITMKYSTTINGFVRYPLTNIILLEGGKSYYIGFSHKLINAVFLGYDRTNDRSDKIFSSTNSSEWAPYKSSGSLPGALMIRPVFNHKEVLTSVFDAKESLNQFTIYPNPSLGELHFSGTPEYIWIYDITGKEVLRMDIREMESINISTLQNGFYLAVLQKDYYSETKRLIIQK